MADGVTGLVGVETPGATGVVGVARLDGAVGATEGLCAAALVVVIITAKKPADNATPTLMTHFRVPRAIGIPPQKSAMPR
jgi:hypothetical protein